MELSLYTYIFHQIGHFYLYNSESRIFAEISEKLYSQLHDRDFLSISNDTLQELKKKKIVIENEEKYLYYYRQRISYFSKVYNNEHIGLTVVPFTGCNFECPYCFEAKKRPLRMTSEVENTIVKFLQQHPAGKYLSLTWYGGEPLMAFQNIKSLYNKIKEETNYTIVRHDIVTNGYLINQEMLDFFKETNLQHMQITLDGTEERHNKTRYLKGTKQGTFNQILENIQSVIEKLPNCKLAVRVNINKDSAEDFIKVYEMLYKRFDTPQLSVYPGFIQKETNDQHSLCYNCLQNEDFIPFYEEFQRQGGHARLFPIAKSKGCMINTLNSYIVGPEGELYKCWEHVGEQDKVIGNVNSSKGTNQILLGRCLNEISVFEDEQCKDCFVFPICGGGCGWKRYKNKFESGRFAVCTPYKEKRFLEQALIDSLKEDRKNDHKTIFL